MDVGNPSNFARILDLYHNDLPAIQKEIYGASFTDEETKSAMIKVFEKHKYILDPHGAVAYLGLEDYRKTKSNNNCNGIFLETAHPAKFKDIVEDTLKTTVEIPERLASSLKKTKKSILLSNKFEDLKDFLLS